MCGIHFVMTQDTFATRTDDYMRDAFIANQVRGMHSSGMFQVNNKHEISMFKQAVNGSEFINTEGAKAILTRVPRSPLTVGHVRHATSGEVNDDNAHPFLITREDGSELVGVHNGTLRDWKNMKGGQKGAVVDSAWAFNMIAEHGDDAFQYFDGAFAMVWYDTAEPEHMYMVRNKERPLHFMTSKDRRTIIGASELGMLGWLAQRNNIEPHTEKQSAFRYLEANTVYRFSLKDIGAFESWDMMKFDSRNRVYVPPVNQYNSLHPTQRGGYHGYPASNDMLGNAEFDEYAWPRRSNVGWKPYEDTRQMKLMEDCHAALDAVMDAASDTLPEVSDAEIEAMRKSDPATFDAIDTAIKRWKKAGTTKAVKEDAEAVRAEVILNSNAVFVSDPNSSSATRSEIAAAREAGVYGQIGKFYGILYDPDDSTILGQLQIYRRGKEMEVEGEIRYMTKRAESKFVEPIEPNFVTIVGVAPPTAAFKETYIVAELNESNKAVMHRHIQRLAKAN